MGHKKAFQCRAIAVAAASVAIWCGLQIWNHFAPGEGIMMMVYSSGLLLSGAVAALFTHITVLQPADSHSWHSLFYQYMFITMMKLFGRSAHNEILDIARCADTAQEHLLLSLLQENWNTDYGHLYKLDEIESREQYREKHPLTSYDHYKDYIDQIANGREDVLTKAQVLWLSTSSGTSTGENKIFPTTGALMGAKAGRLASHIYHNVDRIMPLRLQKTLLLAYKPNVKRSPSGLQIAPVSYFMIRHTPFFTSPPEALQLTNEQAALYVHAVFGLGDPEVGFIDGVMATLVYAFWRLVAANWKQICDDIAHGKITWGIADEELLQKLNRHLKPNPARADELRRQFVKGYQGICMRVWPNCQSARMFTTGSFWSYARLLQDLYMEGVVFMSITHSATEGFYGLKMSDEAEDECYMIYPKFCFFEFIPEENCEEEQPETLFMHELERGKNYEIVVTSPHGLYRYRSGDIIKVRHYVYKCPVYEFLYRKGQMLNLYWEKTPEHVFYEAIEKTADQLGVDLVDFTATESIHLQNNADDENAVKHYVLFVEVEQEGKECILTESQKEKFDGSLCETFENYASMREKESIGPMKVIQVKKDTFLQLKGIRSKATNSMQTKVPRVLRDARQLELLCGEVV